MNLFVKSFMQKFQGQNKRIADSIEEKTWSFTTYWLARIPYKIVCILCHIIVSIVYWGKRKSVPPIKNPLLLLSATKMAEKIRNRELSSEAIVNAYIGRIKEVETYINAVAENRFEKAIEEAKECDYLVRSGIYTKVWLEKEKPLLGVSLTVKVLLKVKGCHSTGAMAFLKDVVATEDAPAVELLKASGAIILASTNSAENGLGLDTISRLYGKTLNPYDLNRSPGGSSGGECALISSAGSVIGLGNDLLGSVRIPAHFTGIFAHKPSRGMVPNTGNFPRFPDRTYQQIEIGPLCRYAEDLSTMMKVLTLKKNEKKNFSEPVNFKKLKIFYQTKVNHPWVETLNAENLTSMKKAINHFTQNYGATAEEVDINMDLAANMVHHLLSDGVNPVISTTTAGKINDVNLPLELLKLVFGKGNLSLWTLITFKCVNNPLIFKEKDIPFYRKLQTKLYKEFENMLDENSVFLCPTISFQALRLYEMIPHLYNAVWSGMFTILGLPATQCLLGLNQSGLPHGMQIVTSMNNDRLGIACAKELSDAFEGWIAPS